VFSLLALIAAGESIFFLPFVLARVFRPTLLEVFGLTNLELGTAFAAYGVVAMVAYLLGGPLADRFSARGLLAIALTATAAGGLLLSSVPQLSSLKILYAYWGFTTIALFWSALIRATREWGGELSQGSAFGLLDGGRGLLTALMGTIMVALYAFLLPEDIESASLAQRTRAFQKIILLLSAFICLTALLLWFALPPSRGRRRDNASRLTLSGLRQSVSKPTVWLQAFIIVCAYVGYKATDDFSLYAKDVLALNEVEAARASTVALWMRPVAAIGAGYLADRQGAGFMTLLSFALLAIGSLVLASGVVAVGMAPLFLLTIVCTSLGIFALRGLYFAIMKEGRIPLSFTGSAVGLVSVIGYTPDIFMGPLMGYLLDQSPGRLGHQQVFLVVAGFSLAGLLASLWFVRITRNSSRGDRSGSADG
jgi:nitrate/nitrite transporter NarK